MAIICVGCQKKDDISEKAPDAASTTESASDVSVSDESAVGEVVSMLALAVSTLWSWWKNNNITDTALYWQRRKDETMWK